MTFDPKRILSFYLLIYIKSAYSSDHTGVLVELPSDNDISTVIIPFYINGKTAYHFHYFMKIFRFEDKWISVYDGYGEQKSVNIKLKHSCEDFECKAHGKVYTYTAKQNMLFNMVNSGLVEKTCEVVWAITRPVDCSNKVVYDEANPNFLVVHIYHVNGKKTSFTKEPDGKWKEYKSTASSNTLSQDKVEVRIESQYVTPAVSIGNNEHYLRYSFYDGVKCRSVEYDKTQLLRPYDGLPNPEYPESVVFALKGNTAFVKFKEYIDILRLERGNWNTVIRGKPQPVSLCVGNKQSTISFEYEKTNKQHIFTAKENNLFCRLTEPGVLQRSDKIMWSTTDLCEYATKVVYDDTFSKNVLTIHHVNGLIRTFKKSISGKWNECGLTHPATEPTPEKAEIPDESQSALPEPNDVPEPTTEVNPTSKSEIEEKKNKHEPHLKPPTGSNEPPSNPLEDKMLNNETKTVENNETKNQQDCTSVDSVDSDESQRSPVHLDLQARKICQEFDYTESCRFWTYTANNGYSFISVRVGTKLIYRSRKSTESVFKAIAEVDSSSIVGLALHLFNRQIKRFNVSDGKLQEMTRRDLKGVNA